MTNSVPGAFRFSDQKRWLQGRSRRQPARGFVQLGKVVGELF